MKGGKPFPLKTLLWIPNPKGKMHILDGVNGRLVLDDTQFKQYQKNVHKTMDRVQQVMESALSSTAGRHDDQRKVNDDQWFVSGVVGVFSDVDEPKKSRKVAEAAVKKLVGAAKSRNYNKFKSAAEEAEAALVEYQNDVNKWTGDLIGTAESTVKNLKRAKDAGIFCGTLVVVTVTAPVSLTAGVLIAGASSGGVNLAYDGFDQIGRAIAGVEPRSTSDIGKRLLINTMTGAAGGLVAGALTKFVAGPLAKALLSKTSISKHVLKLAKWGIPNKIFQKEANILANQLAKKGSKISVEEYIKILSHDRIMTQTLTKLLIRSGNGAMLKHLEAGKFLEEKVLKWGESNPQKVGGKDGNVVAVAAAKDIANSEATDVIFKDYLRTHMKEFRKELRLVMKANATAAAKIAK